MHRSPDAADSTSLQEEELTKEANDVLDNSKRRAQEDVVKALMTADLDARGIPLSADEVILLMKHPARLEAIGAFIDGLKAKAKEQLAKRDEKAKKQAATERQSPQSAYATRPSLSSFLFHTYFTFLSIDSATCAVVCVLAIQRERPRRKAAMQTKMRVPVPAMMTLLCCLLCTHSGRQEGQRRKGESSCREGGGD